ncbi:hypothetical protein QYF36_021298 [Acer negundo]|nr:hypothetical protein QYF36_021298 [Acer negundo]
MDNDVLSYLNDVEVNDFPNPLVDKGTSGFDQGTTGLDKEASNVADKEAKIGAEIEGQTDDFFTESNNIPVLNSFDVNELAEKNSPKDSLVIPAGQVAAAADDDQGMSTLPEALLTAATEGGDKPPAFMYRKHTSAEELAFLEKYNPRRAKRIIDKRKSARMAKEKKRLQASKDRERHQMLTTKATDLSNELSSKEEEVKSLRSEIVDWNNRMNAVVQQKLLNRSLSNQLRHENEQLRLQTGLNQLRYENEQLRLQTGLISQNIGGTGTSFNHYTQRTGQIPPNGSTRTSYDLYTQTAGQIPPNGGTGTGYDLYTQMTGQISPNGGTRTGYDLYTQTTGQIPPIDLYTQTAGQIPPNGSTGTGYDLYIQTARQIPPNDGTGIGFDLYTQMAKQIPPNGGTGTSYDLYTQTTGQIPPNGGTRTSYDLYTQQKTGQIPPSGGTRTSYDLYTQQKTGQIPPSGGI